MLSSLIAHLPWTLLAWPASEGPLREEGLQRPLPPMGACPLGSGRWCGRSSTAATCGCGPSTTPLQAPRTLSWPPQRSRGSSRDCRSKPGPRRARHRLLRLGCGRRRGGLAGRARDAVLQSPHGRPRYSAHEALAFVAASIGRKGWGGRRERQAEGADDLGSEVSLLLPICGRLDPCFSPRQDLVPGC